MLDFNSNLTNIKDPSGSNNKNNLKDNDLKGKDNQENTNKLKNISGINKKLDDNNKTKNGIRRNESDFKMPDN